MTVGTNKHVNYQQLIEGDPISLDQLIHDAKDFSVVNNGIELSNRTMFAIDLTKTDLGYKTLIIEESGTPILTTCDTRTLIHEFDEDSETPTKVTQLISQQLQGNKHYMSPTMTIDTLFIPFTACKNQSATYINCSMIDKIYRPHSTSLDTHIIFYNHLEITIPFHCSTFDRKIQNNFFSYFQIQMHENIKTHDVGDISYTDSWKGRFVITQKELLRDVIVTFNESAYFKEKLVVTNFFYFKEKYPDLTFEEFLENAKLL